MKKFIKDQVKEICRICRNDDVLHIAYVKYDLNTEDVGFVDWVNMEDIGINDSYVFCNVCQDVVYSDVDDIKYNVKNDWIDEKEISFEKLQKIWFEFLETNMCLCNSGEDEHDFDSDVCESATFDIDDMETIMDVEITLV